MTLEKKRYQRNGLSTKRSEDGPRDTETRPGELVNFEVYHKIKKKETRDYKIDKVNYGNRTDRT